MALMGVFILSIVYPPNLRVNSAASPAVDPEGCVPNVLVIFDQPFGKGFTALDDAGGCVVHVFPPRVVIGFLPDSRGVDSLPGASIYRDGVDEKFVSGMDPVTALVARVWNVNHTQPQETQFISPQAHPLAGDTRTVEVELQEQPQSVNGAPGYYNLSAFMAGRVAVGIILPESAGSGENWDAARMNQVVGEIQQGMNWWVGFNPGGSLQFVYDINLQIPTTVEPISLPSYQDNVWISQTLSYLGFTQSGWIDKSYAYLNSLRETKDADWAVLIFVVDSLKDADGMFSDYYFGYTYMGPPVIVMTYDNDNWGIGNMDSVTAHEFAHDFGAGDEYYTPGYATCSCRSVMGYLGIQNVNCEGGCHDGGGGCSKCVTVSCLMRTGGTSSGVCDVSRHQVGMRDSDGDGLLDPVDTFPAFTITSQPNDNGANPTVTYTGSVNDIPWTSPTGPSMTINTITSVQYSLDDGAWLPVPAVDGIYDEVDELFSLTIYGLGQGDHQIKLIAVNRWGNSTEWMDSFSVLEVETIFLPVLLR